jgi:hypothetical protein
MLRENNQEIMPHTKIYLHTFIFSLLFIFSIPALAQQKFTLNGFVKDSLTGETLLGANLSIQGSSRGVASNAYGFYSITLEKNHYLVSVHL